MEKGVTVIRSPLLLAAARHDRLASTRHFVGDPARGLEPLLRSAELDAPGLAIGSTFSSRYVARTLRTPGRSFDAMSAPSRRQKGSSSSCATTWFTSPHSSAVRASTKLPVTLISLARRWPTASARSTVSPQPGMMPTRAWVSAKRARSDATRKSHVSATSKPPVTAAPLTAPMTGFVVSGNGRMSSSSPATMCFTSESLPSDLRSTPAQNAGSAPVSTMASTSSRASHAAIASGSAAVNAGSSALRAAGRLRVTTATRSATSTRITSSPIYRPVHLGSRFSKNASTPSCTSSLPRIAAVASSVASHPSASRSATVRSRRAQTGAHSDRADGADAGGERRARRRRRHPAR